MLEKAPDNGKSKENRQFFSEKTFKKSLTKRNRFDILDKLARPKTVGKSEANLENDTERKKRAIKEEDSEDSKELSIERC